MNDDCGLMIADLGDRQLSIVNLNRQSSIDEIANQRAAISNRLDVSNGSR
jgi:hypothetical protein